MKKDISFLKGIHIAHRGLFDNKKIPENSKEAFQKAISEKIPIELDIQILKDDIIVVFHDDNLKRMTGKEKKITDCTYEEIKDLTLLSTNSKIPLFEDVLKQVNGKVLLDIELKTSKRYRTLLKKAIPLLDAYQGDFLVKSFDPRIVFLLKKYRPSWVRGLLASNNLKENKKHPLQNYILKHLLTVPLIKPDFIAYDKRGIENTKIKRLRKKMPVLVWTLKGEKEVREYQSLADGYIFERKNK